jgi:hypothetical protein
MDLTLMTKLALTITALTFTLGLTACAELKTVGRDIGHASRDIVNDVSAEVKN